MAETVYNRAKLAFMEGDLDLEAHDIRTLLLSGSVTINPDHATVAAVIAANTEVSHGTYGRVACTGETCTQNDTDNRAEFDVSNVDYGALASVTPTALLMFRFITNDSDSIPISIHDSGFGAPANGAGYVVTFPNDVLRLT